MTNTLSAGERLAEVLQEEALGERALRAILRREEFDQADIDAAVQELDWDELAARAVEEESSLHDAPQMLQAVLRARGFTPDQASAAVTKVVKAEPPQMGTRLWELFAAGQDNPEAPTPQELFGSDLDEEELQKAIAGDAGARVRIMARSALNKGVSRQGLQEALESLGLPAKTVREQLRDLKPNWKQQAVLFAEGAAVALDREAIQEAMRQSGFTPVQVAFAMNFAHIDDQEAAIAFAHSFLEHDGSSLENLRKSLEERGFEAEDAEAAVAVITAEDPSWIQAGIDALRSLLRDPNMLVGGEETFRTHMLKRGYSEEQITGALMNFDWVQRAIQDYVQLVDSQLFDPGMASKAKIAAQMEMMGYDPETAAQAAAGYIGDVSEREMTLLSARAMAELIGSPARLREELRDGGHDEETIAWILERVFTDPVEDAAHVWSEETAKLLAEGIVASPLDMVDTLTEEGFDPEILEEVDTLMETPWPDIAGMYAVSLRADDLGEDEIRQEMLEEKFAPEDVEEALVHIQALSAVDAADTMRVTSLLMRYQMVLDRIQLLEQQGDADSEEELEALWDETDEIRAELDELGAMPPGFDGGEDW